MNLSPRWARFLSDAGFDATHWSSVGKANANDSEVTAYAVTNNYVILTCDLDFGAILAATRQSVPSLIQLRAEDVSPEAVGPQTVAALRHLAAQLQAAYSSLSKPIEPACVSFRSSLKSDNATGLPLL